MSAEIQFWLLFALLNTCYFIPRYLLELGSSDFFPYEGFLRDSVRRRLRYFVIRLNYDVFRVSVDLLVICLLYSVVSDNISWHYFGPLLWLFFGSTLVYQVYYTAFDRIYHLQPLLFNDWFMLKVALRIFVYERSWKNFFIAFAAIVFAILALFICFGIARSLSMVEFGWASKAVIVLCVAGGLWCAWKYSAGQFPQVVFQSQMQSLLRNINASITARAEVKGLTLRKMKGYNIPVEAALDRRPNLYFIVIESYGRIIADSPAFSGKYIDRLSELEGRLRGKNWHITSNMTTSAVTGGASWISYTSMLYGLNVKGQGLFLTLFKNERIDEYDSLFNWLRRQGYTTYRLSSLGGYKKMEIPYDRYSRLYGVDHWILHSDLNYRGPEYGFGPSPPDQYALHFAHDRISKQSSKPFALFFISQNSHSPFESPTEVVDDWRDLVDETAVAVPRSKIWSRPKLELYGEAIDYQLRFIADFIEKKGTSDDIFILIGDHQPASLSIPIESFETPIHVISKNERFVRTWQEYGFAKGLDPRNAQSPIAQEALLWAFYRSVLRTYGITSDLPPFLEKGIPF